MDCCHSVRDLAWELEGDRFKSSMDQSIEGGLVAGEVPVNLLGTPAFEQGTNPPTPNCPLHVCGCILGKNACKKL